MNKEFNQLCVWEGTILGDSTIEEFETFFRDNGFTVKFMEEVVTKPTPGKPGTGGRHDILFYIADEDIPRFAIWRIERGIKWWEDVVFYNKRAYLYSPEILAKYPVKW